MELEKIPLRIDKGYQSSFTRVFSVYKDKDPILWLILVFWVLSGTSSIHRNGSVVHKDTQPHTHNSEMFCARAFLLNYVGCKTGNRTGVWIFVWNAQGCGKSCSIFAGMTVFLGCRHREFCGEWIPNTRASLVIDPRLDIIGQGRGFVHLYNFSPPPQWHCSHKRRGKTCNYFGVMCFDILSRFNLSCRDRKHGREREERQRGEREKEKERQWREPKREERDSREREAVERETERENVYSLVWLTSIVQTPPPKTGEKDLFWTLGPFVLILYPSLPLSLSVCLSLCLSLSLFSASTCNVHPLNCAKKKEQTPPNTYLLLWPCCSNNQILFLSLPPSLSLSVCLSLLVSCLDMPCSLSKLVNINSMQNRWCLKNWGGTCSDLVVLLALSWLHTSACVAYTPFT